MFAPANSLGMPTAAGVGVGQDRVHRGGRAVDPQLPGRDDPSGLPDHHVGDRDDPVVEPLAVDQLRHHLVQPWAETGEVQPP